MMSFAERVALGYLAASERASKAKIARYYRAKYECTMDFVVEETRRRIAESEVKVGG